MKVFFTLAVGVAMGWITALFDTQGQLALEQHQQKVEATLLYQADAAEIEEDPVSSIFFVWP
ncbi:hypothetical protein [Rufibacter latericius]|uniref:Uncharacterized protein n=1 Tax=Rufibacter latericius TaxID=2487040 RepID=A0A3M9MY77_9BACT|nr:hypothetical protein [Rufibacter latericius]RNI30489.1 hypothetical protein EFB08_04315 [Rufibacter latericius]